MSDVSNDRKLDEEEFIVAMFLISSRLKNGVIPDVPSSSPNTSSTSSPATSAPSSPAVSHSSNIPKLNAEERNKYKDIFKRASSEGSGNFIDSDQARKLFAKSNLPSSDLSKIW